MKKTLFVGLMSVLAVMVLTGCKQPCQSLLTTYTEENLIDIPEGLIGTFMCEQSDSDGETVIKRFYTVTLSPNINENGILEVTEKTIKNEEETTAASTHEVVFFNINGYLFVDGTLREITSLTEKMDGEEFPGLAMWQFVPRFHLMTMIIQNENSFEVYSPDPETIVALAKENSVNLPHVKIDNSKMIIFTATGEQWHAFLEQYADLLFEDQKPDYVFVREQNTEKTEVSDPDKE